MAAAADTNFCWRLPEDSKETRYNMEKRKVGSFSGIKLVEI